MGGKSDALLDGASSKNALALLRIDHQGMSLRRLAVDEMMANEVERVEHIPRLRIVNLEMQMRSRRGTGVTADGNKLSFGNRKVGRSEMKLALSRLFLILLLAHHRLNERREFLQMAIDAGVALRMMHVDGIAKTHQTDGDHRHVAAGN